MDIFADVLDTVSQLGGDYAKFRLAEMQLDAAGVSQQQQAQTVEVPQQTGRVPETVTPPAPSAGGVQLTTQQMMMLGVAALLAVTLVVGRSR